jgi:hypothetical protein
MSLYLTLFRKCIFLYECGVCVLGGGVSGEVIGAAASETIRAYDCGSA